MATKTVGVRVRPEVLTAVREVLGLNPDTSEIETVRAALSHVTNIPPAQMVRPRGGPRPNSGPKRHGAQAA